jgi:hypothetical protein
MTPYDMIASATAFNRVVGMPISRRDKMTFKVTIPRIEEKYLVEIQGRYGPCYIVGIGNRPELEHGFYYGDARYEFCFYAEIAYHGNEFDIDVYDASVRRFDGPSPIVKPEDLDYIKESMAKFFETRAFIGSGPIDPNVKLRSLAISGGFRFS